MANPVSQPSQRPTGNYTSPAVLAAHDPNDLNLPAEGLVPNDAEAERALADEVAAFSTDTAAFNAAHPEAEVAAAMAFAATEADAANEAAIAEMNAVFAEQADLEGKNGKPAQYRAELRRDGMVGLAIRDLPEPAPLVAGLLDLDSLAVLFGPPGCGKSFIALDLAWIVATGGTWQGVTVDAQPVMYIVAEGASGIGQRLDAWRSQFREPPDMSNVHWLVRPVNMFDTEWAEALADHATNLGVKFIVADTLARSMAGGNESDTKDMGVVIADTDLVRRATGGCFMFVHHTGWAEGHHRGARALEGAVDTELEVKGGGSTITLKTVKQKHHEGGQTWQLALTPRENSCVVAHAAEADRLHVTAQQLLVALVASDDGTGLSATAWKLSSGIEDRTYYRLRKQLVDLRLVGTIGSRYQATAAGRAQAGGA